MPEIESAHSPAFVRASAYTPAQVAQLGVPRGLVAYLPSEPVAEAPQPALSDDSPTSTEPTPAAISPTLGLGPRTRYRFQAHSMEAAVLPPSNLTTDPATSRRAGAVRKMPKVSAAFQLTSLALVAAAAAFAGYYLALPNQESARSAAVDTSRTWTPTDQQKLDIILMAETAGHATRMKELVEQLATTRPNLNGLRSLEARAAVAQRSFSEADVALSRAAQESAGDRVDAALARAFHMAKQRRFVEMRAWLTEAIAQDPTRAELYFLRAESDRRLGRTQDALEGFETARGLALVGRRPTPETIDFRRRLLLIERGRESEIDAKAYRDAFAHNSPSADWMLIAAAIALQRRDMEAAARWLRAARHVMPWQAYVERLDDYVFRNHIDEPGLHEFFPTPAERVQAHAVLRPVLVDP